MHFFLEIGWFFKLAILQNSQISVKKYRIVVPFAFLFSSFSNRPFMVLLLHKRFFD